MSLTKLDYRNLGIITIYSLVFFVIRILPSSHSMTYDEAEQFIDASSFQLGYLDQPPLYSWIIKCFSLVFGMNTTMMVFVYHLIAFIFLVSIYFLLKEIWQDKYAWLIQCSFLFFFIFSYDFYRYTIHTALASMFCALSMLIFIRIFKYKLLRDYALLGLCFGLGLLSKYNFLFFIVVLVLACLSSKTSRSILLNSKANLSILIMLLVFAPHFYWLYENDFPSIAYAMQRGEAGDSTINYIGVLLNTYWNVLVYLGVFILFFFKDFNSKHLEDEPFFITLRMAGVLSILVPLFAIIVLQAGNFSQRWMAPLNIFIPLALFSFVEFKEKSLRYKLFFIVCTIMALVFYGARISSYFFPDKFGLSFINKPHKQIYKDLENNLSSHNITIEDVEFIGFDDITILGGIRSFYPKAEVEILRKHSKLDLNKNKIQIIVWEASNDEDFKKTLEKREEKYRYIFSKSTNFLHAKELEPYQVNFAFFM